MNAADLIGLVSAGPNATIIANLGSDPTWNVCPDWGLDEWKVVRVPVGIKFQRCTNGLVSESVVVARGGEAERARHQKLQARARVPMHVVLVQAPHQPHNRLARPSLFLQGGSDE
jgi:hypothetical protein